MARFKVIAGNVMLGEEIDGTGVCTCNGCEEWIHGRVILTDLDLAWPPNSLEPLDDEARKMKEQALA